MKPVPVHCGARHPKVSGWVCNGLITRVIPGTVTIEVGRTPGPGCSVHRCKRCGAEYVVCPVEQVA